MKKQLIFTALGAMLLASCADTWDRVYEGGDPQKEGYEYLADYAPLKEYVDRSKYPNFKVALAIEANDYNKQELVYALANSNFNELVTGNAMKMASCVDENGNMSFGTVTEFINNATNAGVDVYGHTLAWHSQQPIKWLTSLLEDKQLPVDPNASNSYIKYTCGDPGANTWDKQAIYSLATPMEKGAKYTVAIDVKASASCELALWPIWDASDNKNQWGGSNDVQYLEAKVAGEDWATVEWTFDAAFPLDKLQFVFGKHGGFIAFDNLVVKKDGSDENLVENGDFANPVTSGWTNNWNGPSFEIITEGSAGAVHEIVVERRCIQVKASDKVSDPWDTQFWIMTDATFATGDKWEVSMDVRADQNAGSETQVHAGAGSYLHWEGIGNVPFTTKWTTYTASGTIKAEQNGGHSIAFNLNVFAKANSYYFDNISFKLNGVELIKNSSCDDDNMKDNFVAKENQGDIVPARFVDSYIEYVTGNTIPLTPEEKKDTLTWAMDKWIGGMMEACAGKVKAWDVVNEAISGDDNDGDGYFDLQHSEGYDKGSWDVGGDAFYWQDYLGDLDYVRTAVASARKHFEANGGTPSDLKLFVNDYNLESDWDNNKKLKSLINWIKKWEADGVTKIDGIGTQMHINCFENDTILNNFKKHITQMFELMAASGKLVRVSELDMGYVRGSNRWAPSSKTDELTEAEHKKMADFYEWIIKEYFRIIPADQQWGICQWCATDAPASSGWRGGEPVGLWDSNYYRKHTYAGFADGLSGK